MTSTKQIKFLISALSILIFTNSVYASSSDPNAPEKCPSTSAILAAGFEGVNCNQGVCLLYNNSSNFDTKDPGRWKLYIPYLVANTKSEAIAIAEKAIKSVYLVKGPTDDYGGGYQWACDYEHAADPAIWISTVYNAPIRKHLAK